jgi:hypothetical protein
MAPFIPRAPKGKRAEKTHKPGSNSLPMEQPTRIGFGEYSHPTLHDKAGRYAKLEFIGKIEEIAQEVLVDLAESVRPNYERIRAVIDQDELLSLDAETLRDLAKDRRNDFGGLLAALEAWTERYSLNADWVRNMALRTLFHWTGKIVATKGQRLQFIAPISGPNSKMAEVPFSFSESGWRITDETRTTFVARITAEFDSYLAGYMNRVESRAKKAGWMRTTQIRKSEKGADAFRHFEWLVRWQCQRWTTTKIAKEYGLGNPRKAKSAKGSTEIHSASHRETDRTSYAAQRDSRRKAAYRSVHDALEQTAELLDLPRRLGKKADKNNLSQ